MYPGFGQTIVLLPLCQLLEPDACSSSSLPRRRRTVWYCLVVGWQYGHTTHPYDPSHIALTRVVEVHSS